MELSPEKQALLAETAKTTNLMWGRERALVDLLVDPAVVDSKSLSGAKQLTDVNTIATMFWHCDNTVVHIDPQISPCVSFPSRSGPDHGAGEGEKVGIVSALRD